MGALREAEGISRLIKSAQDCLVPLSFLSKGLSTNFLEFHMIVWVFLL